MQRKQHWNSIYQNKSDTEVSWFEPEPQVSLELIRSVASDGGSVIDIGGGASRLVDRLLAFDFRPVGVLDVSEVALRKIKDRLGEQSRSIRWIVGDVTELPELGQYDVWHDRAVFHFLTDSADRKRYAALAAQTVRPGGHAILGTFALDGPQKCSGLQVCRYDAAGLARELGPAFWLVREHAHRHVTPSGMVQSFCFAVLQRVPEEGDP